MIRTNDIDLAGYLMSEKFKIANVELSSDNRWPVVFSLAGENEKQEKEIRKQFDNKTAVVNVRNFIEHVASIKQIAFSIRRNGHDHFKNGQARKNEEANYEKHRHRKA